LWEGDIASVFFDAVLDRGHARLVCGNGTTEYKKMAGSAGPFEISRTPTTRKERATLA
jgi:hypothetical protein